jgi:hypothetical protein
MHESLLFLFYVEKKNLVKDQFIINKCLSAYLLQIVHLRIGKKNLDIYKSDHEKSSSSSTILSSFFKRIGIIT